MHQPREVVQHNLVLSQDRAAAVAAYLEARGVPKSSLLVVGHGASDLVAPGWSGDNRRVVVAIENPQRQALEPACQYPGGTGEGTPASISNRLRSAG